MAERFFRLRFELPAGVAVRTRADIPKRTLPGGVLDLFAGFTTETHEYKSNQRMRLELDVPEAEIDKVIAALRAAKR